MSRTRNRNSGKISLEFGPAIKAGKEIPAPTGRTAPLPGWATLRLFAADVAGDQRAAGTGTDNEHATPSDRLEEQPKGRGGKPDNRLRRPSL